MSTETAQAPTGMLLGYARVSTADQTLALQQDALAAAGCGRIFTDTASGAKADRPGLAEAIDYARAGDTLVVWRLDRLGRSLPHLIETVGALEARGIAFRSLTESLDTTTSGGRLIFHIFASLAEFERAVIRERTHAGLVAARARGHKGGRPRVAALADPEQMALARHLYEDEHQSATVICKMLRISRSTFYRYLSQPATARKGARSVARAAALWENKRTGRDVSPVGA